MAEVSRIHANQNIPLPRTPLIGREQIVSAAIDLLLRPSVSLLTLTGPPGIGKTRLALHVAADLQDQFAQGACFVSLATVRDAYLVPPAIAEAFGIVDGDESSLIQRLRAFLFAKDMLLVIDNCEHVVDAATFISELLLSCPSLKILATSRTSLRISGEHDFPVPALTLPDASLPGSFASLTNAASVVLFVQKAMEADPSFVLTESNAPDVAEICIRLDGLPLAIELAAARTRMLTPGAVRARLVNRLALLTGGPRDQPPRLRAMRDAIAWSYDLLSPDEQILFRRLSVFVGSFSLEAIDRMAPATESGTNDDAHSISSHDDDAPLAPAALHLLTQLVDKSLVQVGRQVGNDARFQLLETIREFGYDRLTVAGEEIEARDFHAQTYLELAECAERHLRGPRQALWFNRMDHEHPNLRAALAWFRERGQLALALRLAGALGRFWEARGHLGEGREWLEKLLAAANGRSDVPLGVLAKAENWAGTLTYWQGDFAKSDARHACAAHQFAQAGDAWGEAYALLNQGQSASFGGDLERAIVLIETSVERFQAIGDPWGIAAAKSGLANPLMDTGDLDRLGQTLSESLPLVRAVGDPDLLAMTLINEGWMACWRGEDERAERALAESLSLFREIGDRRTTPYTLNLLGLLAWRRGEWAQSASLFLEALTLCRDLGNQLGVVNCLETLEGPALRMGQYERVATLLGASESVRAAIGSPLPPVERSRIGAAAATSREALGEAAFEAAFAIGRAFTLHEAIADGMGLVASLATFTGRDAGAAPAESFVLSRREQDVLRLLVEGHSNPDIAAALFISPKTVRNHVTNILSKIGVESRTAAATFALRNGLV